MSDDRVLAALTRLEAQMAEGFVSADAKMTELRSELRREITELRSELRGEVTGLRTVLMGKLEQVQNELTAIREDLSVAGFAAMRAVKRTDADREDMQNLNELVNTVLKSLMRLRTDVDELRGRK